MNTFVLEEQVLLAKDTLLEGLSPELTTRMEQGVLARDIWGLRAIWKSCDPALKLKLKQAALLFALRNPGEDGDREGDFDSLTNDLLITEDPLIEWGELRLQAILHGHSKGLGWIEHQCQRYQIAKIPIELMQCCAAIVAAKGDDYMFWHVFDQLDRKTQQACVLPCWQRAERPANRVLVEEIQRTLDKLCPRSTVSC